MTSSPATILYTSLSGDLVGGGQHSLRLIVERLDRLRYHPVVLCPNDGDFAASMRGAGVNVEIVPLPPVRRFNLSAAQQIATIIGKRAVRLVHTDSPRGTLYAGIAVRVTKTPLIWHVRTSEHQNPLFERLLYALSTRIIAVSGAAASRFSFSRSLGKVSTVFNAVDTTRFTPRSRSDRMRKEVGATGKLLAVTAGQLLPRKGQETFIKAAAQISRSMPDQWRFLVVGRGEASYEEYLKNLVADLGIEKEIVFTGFRNDMPVIMASADVFVLATQYREGLSRVLLEAMASALPIITTPLGGNTELVQEGITGLLVKPSDEAALARAMQTLARDESLRKKMGEAGRSFVEQRCSIAVHIGAIEKVYQDLL